MLEFLSYFNVFRHKRSFNTVSSWVKASRVPLHLFAISQSFFYRFMALWRLITDLVRFWQNLICLLSLWAKPFCPLRGIHQYDFQLAWYVSIINSLVCQFVSVAITELLPFECPPGRSFTLLQNYTQKDCYRLKIIILTYGDDSCILKCDITFSCLSPYRIT